MSKFKPHTREASDSTITEREVLIEERTVVDTVRVEENEFVSSEPYPPDAFGPMTRVDHAALESADAAGRPRAEITRPRQQGELSDSQFRLLQNLERLTHSLQGPEDSLDRHGYSRPFPPARPTRRA